jgi:beta-galactosidase
MNGVSQGIRKRDSQDFPAAGLRWNVVYKKGNNQIKVVAQKGKTILTDEISQEYQTEKWGEVAKIGLKIEPVNDKEALVVAQLYDENGVRCLDSRDFVEFDLTGDDQLVVNQGTVTGSKKIQARNGRAEIRVVLQKKNSVVSVKTAKARTEFISIN